MASSAILESPSAERNKGPIYNEVLAPIVYPQLIKNVIKDKRNKVNVLELAAGCGVHSTHFASSFLAANEGIGLQWHPSDPDAEGRLSIDARVQQAQLEGSFIPANSWILGKSGGTSCNDGNRDRGDSGLSQSGIEGDTSAYSKYHSYFDCVMCINMIHISPWSATVGLMECAGKVMRKRSILMCYGPFMVGGTAVESNLRFDASLQSRNSDWGVRNLEDVVQVAKSEGGLEFVQSIEMPANNLCVLFRKA